MAFKKEENIIFFIVLVITVTVVPLVATQNIDCKGKAFHCVNSTHFKICVDLGGGISTTVDDFVIPCPKNTVCKGSNYFECEYIGTTTLKPTEKSEGPSDKSVTPSLKNVDFATTIYNNISENKLSQIVVSTTPSSSVESVDYFSDSVLSNITSDLSESDKKLLSETKFVESTTTNEGLTSKTTKVTLNKIDYNDTITINVNIKSIEISNTPDNEIKKTLPESNFSKSLENYNVNPSNEQLPVTIFKSTTVPTNISPADFATEVIQNASVSYSTNNNPNISYNINNLIETENISLGSYLPYNLTNITTEKNNYLKYNKSAKITNVTNNEMTTISESIIDPSVELTNLNFSGSMSTTEIYEDTEITETVKYTATNENIFYNTATVNKEAENHLSTVKDNYTNINDSRDLANSTSTPIYSTTELSNFNYTSEDMLQSIDKSSVSAVKPFNTILSTTKLPFSTEHAIIKEFFTPNINFETKVYEDTVTDSLIENANYTQSNNRFANVTTSTNSSLKLNEKDNNKFVSYISYKTESTLKPQETSQSYDFEQSSLSSKSYNNAMSVETTELTSTTLTSDVYTSMQNENPTKTTLYFLETKSDDDIPFEMNAPDDLLTKHIGLNIVENTETASIKTIIPGEAFTTVSDIITDADRTMTDSGYGDVTNISTNSFISTDKTTSDIGIDVNSNKYANYDNLGILTDYMHSNESAKSKYIEHREISTVYPTEFADSTITSTILDKITIENIEVGNNITYNKLEEQEMSYNETINSGSTNVVNIGDSAINSSRNILIENKNKLVNTQIQNPPDVTDLFRTNLTKVNISENIDVGLQILGTTINILVNNTNKDHTDMIKESPLRNLKLPEIKIDDNINKKDINLKQDNNTQNLFTTNVSKAKDNSKPIYNLKDTDMHNNFTAQDTNAPGINKYNLINMSSAIINTKQTNTIASNLKVSQEGPENNGISKPVFTTTTDKNKLNDNNTTQINMNTLNKSNVLIANSKSNEALSGLNVNKESNVQIITNFNNTKQVNIGTKDNKEGNMQKSNNREKLDTKNTTNVIMDTTDVDSDVTVKNFAVNIPHGIVKNSVLKVDQKSSNNIQIGKQFLSTTTDIRDINDDNITRISTNMLDKNNLTLINTINNKALSNLTINRENTIQIPTNFIKTKPINVSIKDNKEQIMHKSNNSEIVNTKYTANVNMDTTDIYSDVTVKNYVVDIPHGIVIDSGLTVSQAGSEINETSRSVFTTTTDIGELNNNNTTEINLTTLDYNNIAIHHFINNKTSYGSNINRENNIQIISSFNNTTQINISTNEEENEQVYNESKITNTKYAADVNKNTTDIPHVTIKNSHLQVSQAGSVITGVSKAIFNNTTDIDELNNNNTTEKKLTTLDHTNLAVHNFINNEASSGLNINGLNNIQVITNFNNTTQINISTNDNKEVNEQVYNESKITDTMYAADANIDTTDIPHGAVKDGNLQVYQTGSKITGISKSVFTTTTDKGELNDNNTTQITVNTLNKTNLSIINSINNGVLSGLNINTESNIKILTYFNNTKQTNVSTKDNKGGNELVYNESKITDTKYATDVNTDTTDIPHGTITDTNLQVSQTGSKITEISQPVFTSTTDIGEINDNNTTEINVTTLDKTNLTLAIFLNTEALSDANIKIESTIQTPPNFNNTNQTNISTKDNKEENIHKSNDAKMTNVMYKADANMGTTGKYGAITVKNYTDNIPHESTKDSDLKISQEIFKNNEMSKQLLSTIIDTRETNVDSITKINTNMLDKTNLTIVDTSRNETLSELNFNKDKNIQEVTNFRNINKTNIGSKNYEERNVHVFNEFKITDTTYAANVNTEVTDKYGATTVKIYAVISTTTNKGELYDNNVANFTIVNSISNGILSGLNISKENNTHMPMNFNNIKKPNISTKDNKDESMDIINDTDVPSTQYTTDVNMEGTVTYGVTVNTNQIPYRIIKNNDLKVSKVVSENVEKSTQLLSPTTDRGELNDRNINMSTLDEIYLTNHNSTNNETLFVSNINRGNNTQIPTNFDNTNQTNISTKGNIGKNMHISDASDVPSTQYTTDVNMEGTITYDDVTISKKEIPHRIIKNSDLKVYQEISENVQKSTQLLSSTTDRGKLKDNNITDVNMTTLDQTYLTIDNFMNNKALFAFNINRESNIQIPTNFDNTKETNMRMKDNKEGFMHISNDSDIQYKTNVNIGGVVTVNKNEIETSHRIVKNSDLIVSQQGFENFQKNAHLLSTTTERRDLNNNDITKINVNTLGKTSVTIDNSTNSEVLSNSKFNRQDNIQILTNVKQTNLSTKENEHKDINKSNVSIIINTSYIADGNMNTTLNTTDEYSAITVKNYTVNIPHRIIKDSDLKVPQESSINIEISKQLRPNTTDTKEINDDNITKINTNILDKTNLSLASTPRNEIFSSLNFIKEKNIQKLTNFSSTKLTNIGTKESKEGNLHVLNESKITNSKNVADIDMDTTDKYGANKNYTVNIPHKIVQDSDLKVSQIGFENTGISKSVISTTMDKGELNDNNTTEINVTKLDITNLTIANARSNETLSGLNFNKGKNIQELTNFSNTKHTNIDSKPNTEGNVHVYIYNTTDKYDAETVKNYAFNIPRGIIEDSDLKVPQAGFENTEIGKPVLSTIIDKGELNNNNTLGKTNITIVYTVSNEATTNFNNTKVTNISTKDNKEGKIYESNDSKITDTKYVADVIVDTSDTYGVVTVKNNKIEIHHDLKKDSDLKVPQEGFENTYISKHFFSTVTEMGEINSHVVNYSKSENTTIRSDFNMDTTVASFSATRIAENIINNVAVNDNDKIKILPLNNSGAMDSIFPTELVLSNETINIGASKNNDTDKNTLNIKGDVSINKNSETIKINNTKFSEHSTIYKNNIVTDINNVKNILEVTNSPLQKLNDTQTTLKYDLVSQQNNVNDSPLFATESITASAITNTVHDILLGNNFITSHSIKDKAVTQNIPETLKYDITTLPYEETDTMKDADKIITERNNNGYGNIYTKEHQTQVTFSSSVTTHNIRQILAPPPIDKLTPFTCRIRNHGKYPDENDCSKFYICIGKILPIIGKCPSGTVYSGIKKQCSNNLSHCIRNNQFRCLAEGRYIDVLSNNHYYICAKNKKGFVRFKLKCQEGYYLNRNSVHCLLKETSFEDDSKNTSESRTRESNSIETLKFSKTFICTEEGKFEFPEDCRKYYMCTKKSSEFRRRLKQCDSDEVFDRDKRKCVDEESYECRF